MVFKKMFFHIKNNILIIIGFLLSPFSWWNDVVVNFPIAYFFAFLVGRIWNFFVPINKIFFVSLFVLGYWVTNIIGMVMLKKGATDMLNYEKKSHMKFKWDLAAVVIYSLAGAWLIFGNHSGVLAGINVIPNWVRN